MDAEVTAGGHAPPPRPYKRPGTAGVVLTAALLLAVTAAVVFGFAATGRWIASLVVWFVGRPALSPFRSLLLRADVLAFVGAAILIIGLPGASRFRWPQRFRSGIIAIAVAIATFWPLQSLAGMVVSDFAEVNVLLRGLAFFVTICIFTGGSEALRRANDTPYQDSWEIF